MPAGSESAAPPRVVFIRGITRRSGTNYLSDFVRLHPSCARARTDIWEDFALDDAQILDRYITRLIHRFPSPWPVPREEVRDQLMEAFGEALFSTLVDNPRRPGTTAVAKTPSVRGLDYFFHLFPNDPLLVLVRDGRAATESLMRSFDLSFDHAAREWVEGADDILRFRKANAATEGTRWLLLRYEDIFSEPGDAARRICSVTGLDPAGFDDEAFRALPVRGSSSFQTADGVVHWKPVDKDESFKPLERAASWDDDRHRRFNWLAGRQMTELGYALEGPPPALADRVRQPPRDAYDAMNAAAHRARLSWLFRGMDAKMRRLRSEG